MKKLQFFGDLFSCDAEVHNLLLVVMLHAVLEKITPTSLSSDNQDKDS